MNENEFKDITLEELDNMYTKEEVGDFVLNLIAYRFHISKEEALKNFSEYKDRLYLK